MSGRRGNARAANDMSIVVETLIDSPLWDAFPQAGDLARRVVAQCQKSCARGLAPDCEVSVAFCDDGAVRALNAQWRKIDRPTNVLSFPTPGDLANKAMLGDIVVAYETVAREARDEGKRFEDHVAHMVMHGFLHLVGYDHEDPAEAEVMEEMERTVAAALGMRDPYDAQAPDKREDRVAHG